MQTWGCPCKVNTKEGSHVNREIHDRRHIAAGLPIPSEGYADQPYVVRTDDGAWLCTMTTGCGEEGAHGQHVISMRSTDRGRTWGDRVDVEPAEGPESSYSVLLKTPTGRIYCFYNHNTDNIREVLCEDGVTSFSRVDSLGHYVFKYSDDHGRSWSDKRTEVPVREFACDRENIYGGKLRFFWNVGRPLIAGDCAYLVLHKVGAMGAGFFAKSEGCFLRSDNILTERDPKKIIFETLPKGDTGLRAPAGGGRVAEEQSVVQLSDGSLFCVYRTVDGWPACAYSRNAGKKWTSPAYLTYGQGKRRVKHPRAANFVWKCSNGFYLYWFHNHGGDFIQADKGVDPYEDRNPAWLMAGKEVDTSRGRRIEWSQPEILLYDDDPYIRMSYPDMIEEDGSFWITETQKNIGRVHEVDPTLLDGLFEQWDRKGVPKDGLLLDLPVGGEAMPETAPMPGLPRFLERNCEAPDFRGRDLRAGFSIELLFTARSLRAGQVLLDTRLPAGAGLCLQTGDRRMLEIVLDDGRTQNRWTCDPGLLRSGRRHHVVVTVDGGPKIMMFVVDGVLCDGGTHRQFGWGRFSPNLRNVTGGDTLRIAPRFAGGIECVRIYGRALRTSEAVAAWRASVAD